MNRQDNRKRRLFSSMSFRINMVLIVVMIILGLSFTNVMTVIVGGVSNMSRMSTMEKVVKKDIEDNIKIKDYERNDKQNDCCSSK